MHIGNYCCEPASKRKTSPVQGQTAASLTNAYWSLHEVISAGDFWREGAAPVSHVVPVSLAREKGQQCLTARLAASSAFVCILHTELHKLSMLWKKGTNCGRTII